MKIFQIYESSYSLLVRDDYQCSKDTFLVKQDSFVIQVLRH